MIQDHIEEISRHQWQTSPEIQFRDPDFVKFSDKKKILSVCYHTDKTWGGWYGEREGSTIRLNESGINTDEKIKELFRSSSLSKKSLSWLAQSTLRNNYTTRKLLQLLHP